MLQSENLDRKICKLCIDLPDEQARIDILQIRAGPVTKHGEIDYDASFQVTLMESS